MKYDVQSHQLNKGFIVTEAKQVGQVVRIVLSKINLRELSECKDIAVDTTGDIRKLGNPDIMKIADEVAVV